MMLTLLLQGSRRESCQLEATRAGGTHVTPPPAATAECASSSGCLWAFVRAREYCGSSLCVNFSWQE